MIIIRLYIWLESSLLIMRQRENLFCRVWSMRPEWAEAKIGGQKEDRNDYIIWLILLILFRILQFNGWIWVLSLLHLLASEVGRLCMTTGLKASSNCFWIRTFLILLTEFCTLYLFVVSVKLCFISPLFLLQ